MRWSSNHVVKNSDSAKISQALLDEAERLCAKTSSSFHLAFLEGLEELSHPVLCPWRRWEGPPELALIGCVRTARGINNVSTLGEATGPSPG